MADTLPINIPIPSSNAVQSYEFIDFQQSTGYVTFYGAMTKNNSTTAYVLTSRSSTYSWDIATDAGTLSVSGSYQKPIDIDFDLLFIRPIKLRGDFIVSVPIKLKENTGGGQNLRCYSIVKIRHWDGSTETDLGSSGGSSAQRSVSGTTSYFVDTHKINITKKVFNRNETLRITVELWYTTDSNASGDLIQIAHDPAGRDTSTGFDWTGEIITLKAEVPVAIT